MAGRGLDAAGLTALVGQKLGVSSWFLLDQDTVSRFADATHDWQYIHTDPERAVQTPFGGTIAHGFLTLSMLSFLLDDAVGQIEGADMSVNYGFNSVRMLSPVQTGKQIRGHFDLKALSKRGADQVQLVLGVTVEIEGQEKPALVAEWLILLFV